MDDTGGRDLVTFRVKSKGYGLVNISVVLTEMGLRNFLLEPFLISWVDRDLRKVEGGILKYMEGSLVQIVLDGYIYDL